MSSKLLNEEQLNKLSTKRLLAYRNKLLSYHETGCDTCDDIECFENQIMLSKIHPEWRKTYKIVLNILAGREHVEK